ncbi:MAG: winged helix-turn-helix transcriptional regulator [Oscillospiraceae bacterium]|nr:winged helix-turn-helix transcriptional regulator [Oscillospiraceae bacterium]
MGVNESFKALSDPVRRDILILLRQGRKSAGELCKQFELTNATISYHLSLLQKADLIYEQREGKYIYYSLNTSIFEEMILWLKELKGGDSDETRKA